MSPWVQTPLSCLWSCGAARATKELLDALDRRLCLELGLEMNSVVSCRKSWPVLTLVTRPFCPLKTILPEAVLRGAAEYVSNPGMLVATAFGSFRMFARRLLEG